MKPQQGLATRVSVGAAWMVALRVGDQLIGAASIAVLARLLLPADFGLVGYSMVALAMLDLVSGFGVDVALIRERTVSSAHFDTAWTINVARGVVLSLAVCALAVPAAGFFSAPNLENVMYAIALVPLISGFENIGVVNFRRDLDFWKHFVLLLTTRSGATLVTLATAWLLRSYWALVIGAIARAILQVALSYAMHAYRPKLSLAQFKHLFAFSKWLMLQNLLTGLNERSPALVVGRSTNADALAYFNVGQEIANLATVTLRAPIRQALFSGFARLSADAAQLSRAFVSSLGVLLLISLPIPVGLGLTAPYVVRLFLGENWMDVVPVLQTLAVFGAVSAFGTSSHLIYWTLNRARITAALSALRLVLLAPLLVWLVPEHGVIGAALALVISSLVVLIADYATICRVLEISPIQLLAMTWRVIVATAVMGVSVVWLQSGLASSNDALVVASHLAQCGAVGVSVYCATLWILWIASGREAGPEQQTMVLLRRLLTSSRESAA